MSFGFNRRFRDFERSKKKKRKPLTISTKTNNKNKSDLPDVPIEKLDYKYLETCEDVEELRDIVAVIGVRNMHTS